jgi:hypothetical protein
LELLPSCLPVASELPLFSKVAEMPAEATK